MAWNLIIEINKDRNEDKLNYFLNVVKTFLFIHEK